MGHRRAQDVAASRSTLADLEEQVKASQAKKKALRNSVAATAPAAMTVLQQRRTARCKVLTAR